MKDFKLKLQIVKGKQLNENVEIFKTEPYTTGYFLIISSNLPGEEGTKETKMMAVALNLTKTSVWNKTFPKPTYFSDRSTGQFGWGYFIPMNESNEALNQKLGYLKELKSDYYTAKKIDPETDTENLTINDIKRLRGVVEQAPQLVAAVADAANATENSEIQQRLDKYLTDLQQAIDGDELFEFLADNYEKAKSFQNRLQGWEYSLLNCFIITTADPTATMAGPIPYWSERNYQIKPEFIGKGIMISKPSTKSFSGKRSSSDIPDKVKWAKEHPNVIKDFLRDNDYAEDESIKGKEYQLAKYITSKRLFNQTKGGRFEGVMVYSNNMVEAIPGKEPIELGGVDFNKLEQDYKQNLTPLYNALLKVCKENSAYIPENLKSNTEDLGNFNKVVSALTKKIVVDKFDKFGGDKKNRDAQTMDKINIRAESIAHIIKKHYKIQSEASKYSIAAMGATGEDLKKSNASILSSADWLINQIDKELKNTVSENHFRKQVKNIIRETYLNENLDAKYSPSEDYKYAVRSKYIIGFQGREDVLYFKSEEEAKNYVSQKPQLREYIGLETINEYGEDSGGEDMTWARYKEPNDNDKSLKYRWDKEFNDSIRLELLLRHVKDPDVAEMLVHRNFDRLPNFVVAGLQTDDTSVSSD